MFCTQQISDATLAAGNGLIELRRIEASREIASTLSKSRNVVYLPSGNNMLLGINPSFANNQ
jgi:prohibitin 1